MASDYGDEAGEKLFDWMMQVGERTGMDAMGDAADRLGAAFKHAREGQPEPAAGDQGRDGQAEWLRLDMHEFQGIEGYEQVRSAISSELSARGVDHRFFTDGQSGREFLIFHTRDAQEVWGAFENLEQATRDMRARAQEQISRQHKERVGDARDARPLDQRAEEATRASEALERERQASQSRQRVERNRQEPSK